MTRFVHHQQNKRLIFDDSISPLCHSGALALLHVQSANCEALSQFQQLADPILGCAVVLIIQPGV